jgi:hypothetical protein
LTEDTNENDYSDACFRANLTEDTNEKYYNDACFSYFQTIWHLFFDFLMLQDKYHIRKLLVNIKLIGY